jgi:hypothetical protein
VTYKRDIAGNYIELQKELISIHQSVWTPFVKNVNSRFWYYVSISPKGLAETFGIVVSNFADNVIAATRLTIMGSLLTWSNSDNTAANKRNFKELSRLGINAARTIHEASNDVAVETVPSSRPTRIS